MKHSTWATLSLLSLLGAGLLACATASEDGGGDPSAGGPVATEDSGTGTSPDDAGTTQPGTGSDGSVAGDSGAVDPGNDPFAGPSKCTSGKTWSSGSSGSAEMEPGMACVSCHYIGGSATKKPFDIAGTVYASGHEPDLCYGDTTASVVITDANGKDHTLTVSAAGNFYNTNYLGFGAIPTPYKAKVTVGGKTRAMVAAQTNGDCNSCHTQAGAMAAPGRIMLP